MAPTSQIRPRVNLAIPGILQLDETIQVDEPVQIASGKGELVCLVKA